MKKQWMTIAALCIGLIFLGAAGFLLSKSPDKGNDESASEVVLLKMDKTALLGVNVQNESGGYEFVCQDKVGIGGLDGLPVDELVLKEIFQAAVTLESQKKVSDGGERLDQFGLDNPRAEVQIMKRDGETLKLSIGDLTPDEQTRSYYVCWENEVYVMAETEVEVFLYGEEQLISKEMTPVYDESSDEILVTEMEIKSREETIRIEHLKSEELAGYLVDSYKITSPVEYAATASISEDFISSLFNLKALAVAAVHPTTEELEAFGLAEPYKEVVVNYQAAGEGLSFRLCTSKPTGSGAVFVQTEEEEVIYMCSTEQITWSEMTVQDFLSRSVLVPDIRSVQTIDIETEEGSPYTFKLENMDSSEEAAVFCNGNALEVENFKNFYYSLISVTAEEILFENFAKAGSMPMILKVTYHYQNGDKDVLTCYEESVRRIYAELDGKELGFRLTASQLETVTNNLKCLIDGKKIEARY